MCNELIQLITILSTEQEIVLNCENFFIKLETINLNY